MRNGYNVRANPSDYKTTLNAFFSASTLEPLFSLFFFTRLVPFSFFSSCGRVCNSVALLEGFFICYTHARHVLCTKKRDPNQCKFHPFFDSYTARRICCCCMSMIGWFFRTFIFFGTICYACVFRGFMQMAIPVEN